MDAQTSRLLVALLVLIISVFIVQAFVPLEKRFKDLLVLVLILVFAVYALGGL